MDTSRLPLAFQAMGIGFQGGNPQALINQVREQEERAERKERVNGLLGEMGISGRQRALLETMPTEATQSWLLDRLTPKPGRAPTQAEQAARFLSSLGPIQQPRAPAQVGVGEALRPALNPPQPPKLTPRQQLLQRYEQASRAAMAGDPNAASAAQMIAGQIAQFDQLYAQPERATERDASQRLRYTDTGEFVFNDYTAPEDVPDSIEALQWRAAQAGLVEGTPEYQAFIANGGRTPDGMEIISTPGGGMTFRTGPNVTNDRQDASPSSPGAMLDVISGIMNDPALDNATGLLVQFFLAAGSAFTSGTFATDWEAYDAANRVNSSQVNLADSTDNEFYLTGVQLEVGTVATPFEHRSYGEELALCQRYYYTVSRASTNTSVCTGHFYLNNYFRGVIHFPVEMRTAPTIESNTGSNYFRAATNGAVYNFPSFLVDYKNTTSTAFYNTGLSGGTSGHGAELFIDNASAYLAVDAEL